MLAGLQMGEFIYEQPAIPDVEYTFKHALTQEVAYNSMLIERRRVLHERAAQAVEELFPERLDDHLAELAHHYNRSGNATKAAHYMARAGLRAAQQSAYSEAIPYVTGALEILKQLPAGVDRDRQELDLLTTLAWLLHVVDPGSPQRQTLLLRARELCEQVGDNVRLTEVLMALVQLNFIRGERGLVRELAASVAVVAKKAAARTMLAGAHLALALPPFIEGQYAMARGHLERAIELFGPGPFRNSTEAYYAQTASQMLAGVLLALGYPAAALAKERELIAAVRRRSDPFSLYSSLYSACLSRVLLRDSRSAAEHYEEMSSIAAEHGISRPEARFFHDWAMVFAGPGADAIAEIHRALLGFALANGPRALMLGTIAEAFGRNGFAQEGLEAVDQAIALDQTLRAAELHRIKGELLLIQDPTDAAQAEGWLRTAIDIARSQSARLFELRASTSLARLLQKQGKSEEARAMLAEVYNWFTEGFEFPDLKDAKALLDELGS